MVLTAEQQEKLESRDSWKRVRVCKLLEFGKTAQRRCFLRRLESFLQDDKNTVEDIHEWLLIQGFKWKKLGQGVHRIVYSLPYGLVIKTTRMEHGKPRFACGLDAAECNPGEYKAAQELPNFVAPVYIYNQRLNVLVMHRLTAVGTSDEEVQNKLTKMTQIVDLHENNVGRFGKKWMILDAGFHGNKQAGSW